MLISMRHSQYVGLRTLAIILLASGIGCAAITVPAARADGQAAITPVPRSDQWWQDRHAAIVPRAAKGGVDLIFIGDSITQGWEGQGKDIWQQRYAPRNAINLGFSGDRTQHVLWRLEHGEIDFPAEARPKLAVVMIGTNNSNGNDHTAEEIAQGMDRVVTTLRTKLPQTRVLLLAVFPRGEKPNPQREKNAKASELASMVADNKMVHYLDIGSRFTDEHGRISPDIMPDYLHLSAKGYEIWAEAIEDKVRELMGEQQGAESRPAPSTK
jgi:beta-glucosidase